MPSPLDKTGCPCCQHPRSHVVDTSDPYVTDEGIVVTFRRRKCLHCGAVYRTRSTEQVVIVSTGRSVTIVPTYRHRSS